MSRREIKRTDAEIDALLNDVLDAQDKRAFRGSSVTTTSTPTRTSRVERAEPEKIALFDLDGSLADYDHSMRVMLQQVKSPDESLPDNLYEAAPHWRARMDLIKRQPGFWSGLEPIRIGFIVYDELIHAAGFKPIVLTKGPRRTTAAWTEKANWVREHLPDAQLCITEDKGLVYGKVLYDDWPDYITRWLEWRPRGKVIMRTTRYNRGFEHPQVLRIPEDVDWPFSAKGLAEFRLRIREFVTLMPRYYEEGPP